MTAIALTIAGSDSSGGAGIQADLKTFAALGVYGASVITALTAQNTQGVRGIHDVPADFIRAQIDAVFPDLDVAAVKIGMLSQVATIEAVAQGLVAHSAKNIVLDPVMVATSGDRLLAPEAVEALREKLVPRALVVTPNLPEAAVLVGASVARNEREMEVQAREILALGARNVLIKGGHGVGDESVDLLIGEGDVVRLSAKRIATTSLHGTGCTLSSAIAAGLARGLDLKSAAQEAKAYVTAAVAAARDLHIGHGHGPLHHFHATWREVMTTRRTFIGAGAAAAGILAAPAVAQSQIQKWRMVTSWPKRLPGPGLSAERIAERIRVLSGGRIDITVHAAGELVPAFEVLDAVADGVAEIAHTAAFYWQGKMPAAAFFTTVPGGLTPGEHVAWVDAGGGQALWDELYAPFGVKPFMGGNTGVCMGGWFRREIRSLADLRGLKLRTLGLGGEVYRRLGATPQTTPPAEILLSLQSGVIDGAEFVGPGTDIALGLYRVAPLYYYPGFNKPNGTGECIVSLKIWNALPDDLKAVIAHACAAEANYALAEMERLNAQALEVLVNEHKVRLAAFPDDLIAAARKQAADVVGELAGRNAITGKVHASYTAFRARTAPWSRISIESVLRARGA